MNEEEIKHFKALLRQGSLRHMNILLDDKFQKELLNIIKDYENLQQENKQLKEDYNKVVHEATAFESKVYELEHIIDELERWLKDIKEGIEELTIGFQEWGHPAKPSIVIDDVLNKLQELKGSDKK